MKCKFKQWKTAVAYQLGKNARLCSISEGVGKWDPTLLGGVLISSFGYILELQA